MLTRRRSKPKEAFFLISMAVVMLAAVACGASAPDTSSQPADTTATQAPGAAAPQATATSAPAPPVAQPGGPSGSLTVALQTLGNEVTDPILETRAGHAQYQAPIFDALLGFDYEAEFGGVGPGVAKEWEMDPDGLSWTFRLGEDLVFHNGDSLTAEDVKFSLERTMFHEESVVSDGRRLNRQLRDPAEAAIDVVDPLTVRMNTNGFKPHFWSLLTRAVFQGGQIMPKNYIEAVGDEGFRKDPIGSGPWQYVTHTVGDSREYEAFDRSHRGEPHFQTLRLLLVPEESTKIAMIRTGAADIIDLAPESAPEVRDAGPKITEIGGPGMFIFQFWGLYFDKFQTLPIADVRVRQAMSLAINRQDIIDFTMNGFAKWPMPFATFPTSVDLDVPRWQQWSREALVYDPEKAKELLKEAGYENGFDVTFWSTNFSGTPYMNDISQAVTGFWEDIGINVDLKVVEYGVWSPTTRVNGHDEPDEGMNGAVSIYRNAGRPLPVARYNTSFHTDGNHYLFGDKAHLTPQAEEFDRLHDLAISERDPVKRGEYTDQIIQLVADNWIGIPILEGVSLYASNPETVGAWRGIYGRGELGDVFQRIPHAEGNPWP